MSNGKDVVFVVFYHGYDFSANLSVHRNRPDMAEYVWPEGQGPRSFDPDWRRYLMVEEWEVAP